MHRRLRSGSNHRTIPSNNIGHLFTLQIDFCTPIWNKINEAVLCKAKTTLYIEHTYVIILHMQLHVKIEIGTYLCTCIFFNISLHKRTLMLLVLTNVGRSPLPLSHYSPSTSSLMCPQATKHISNTSQHRDTAHEGNWQQGHRVSQLGLPSLIQLLTKIFVLLIITNTRACNFYKHPRTTVVVPI